MLYKIGENLDASSEDIARGIMEGELIILPNDAVEAQQFLVAYRSAYNIPKSGFAYLAFSESELDSRFGAFKHIKQYKNFVIMDIGKIRKALEAVTEMEDSAGDSGWLSDAASKAEGSG